MKENSLEQLLAKYQDGTLSADELEQLNKLTHKDEVFAAANRRANGIIRRRTIGAIVSVVAVVGVGIGLLMPRNETPLIAEVQETPVVFDEQPTTVEASPLPQQAITAPTPVRAKKKVTPVAETADNETIVIQDNVEPTVICNNQCDADSVINDIWKFLSA